jgi:hypothetical protein
MSGRFGSGAMKDQQGKAYDSLGRNLSEAATNAFANNYQQERTRQAQTMALTPQLAAEDYKDAERLAAVGDFRDQYNQSLINQDILKYEEGRDTEFNALQRYLALLQSGGSQGSTQTSSTSGQQQRRNPLLGALGGAAAGASIPGLGPFGAIGGGLLGLFG